MSSGSHQTRRQRKAAASNNEGFTIQEVPVSLPDRSGPKGKTLLDIAREREAELHAQLPRAQQQQRLKQKQQSKDEKDDEVDDAPSPNFDAVLNALLYGVTLACVNLTLDVLVWQQYAQHFSYSVLIKRNLTTTLPLLIFVIFVFHSPWFGIARVEWFRQVLFFCMATAAGAYAVLLVNDKQYLAVMKKAPPTGTIWVWAVLEMGAGPGAASLLIIGLWTWANGYKVM